MYRRWNPSDFNVERTRVGAFDVVVTSIRGEEAHDIQAFSLVDPESDTTCALIAFAPVDPEHTPVERLQDALQPGWRAFASLDPMPHYQTTTARVFAGVRVARAGVEMRVYFPVELAELPSLRLDALCERIDDLLRSLSTEK